MQAGVVIGDPKRQQQEREGDDDADGEAPGRAAKKQPGHNQFQIDQPEQRGPDDLGIGEIGFAFGPRQLLAGDQADGEQRRSRPASAAA